MTKKRNEKKPKINRKWWSGGRAGVVGTRARRAEKQKTDEGGC
jgi:hypothetical protein